ncbi:MAG: cytochrome C oxidase subunit IV family protein [Planctomycetota bacterium]
MSSKLTLPDARGEARVIAGPERLKSRGLKPKDLDLPAARLDEVDLRLNPSLHKSFVISFFAALILTAVSRVVLHQFPQLSPSWSYAIGLVAFVVGARLQVRGDKRWWKDMAPRYRDMLILNRRCASCAFDLSNLLPQPDGCTVCPECNAAWRLPEHTKQESSDARPPRPA